MIYSLLLLYFYSTLHCSRKKERKIQTRLHSFPFIHSFIPSISPQPNPTLHSLTHHHPPQHAHPTTPPPRPPPPPPPLNNPQPRHPRHLQPHLTHLSNFTNFQRIFPADLEFSFRYAWIANFGGDFSGDCCFEWNFCGGGSGLWEWEWEWGWKGDGMFFSFLSSSFSK